MQTLQLTTALGMMRLLADGTASADFSSLGIHQEDHDLLTGPRLWVAPERYKVVSLIDQIVWGTMDVIGVPRFAISAEYMAAVIAMFVHPTNMFLACQWTAREMDNTSLADGAEERGAVLIRPGQLFALVGEIHSQDISGFQQRFNKRVGLRDAPQAVAKSKDKN